MQLDGGGGGGIRPEGSRRGTPVRSTSRKPEPERHKEAAPRWASRSFLSDNSFSSSKPAQKEKPRPSMGAMRDLLGLTGTGTLPAPGVKSAELGESDEAKQKREAEEAERNRKEREKVLGITAGALTTTPDLLKEQLDQLTPEEYARLEPRQRAAVDFNTLLSTAARKDLERQDRYDRMNPAQKDRYEKSVNKLFGEDRGSDLVAPETIAVLRQLKIDDVSDDLDDYLNLSVAITADDLKEVTLDQPVPNYVIDGRTPEASRGKVAIAEQLVTRTQELQDKLLRGKQMLQSFQATAASERAIDLKRLGGSSPLASRASLGFGPSNITENGAPGDLNTYFQQAFESLTNQQFAGDRQENMARIQADLNPDELDAFMSYTKTRVNNRRQYGAAYGTNPNSKYDRPKETLKLLGLDK